jgi:hypothetical protein
VSEVAEQLMFEVAEERELGCGPKIPASYSYYSYSATLPRPVALTAGRKYWLSVQADIGNTEIWWGWRRGTRDNNIALNPVFSAYWEADMAFSLTGP